MNILDYVKWRGDLSFSASPFNEVDGLIFSKISYIVFDGVVSSDVSKSITIAEAYNISSDWPVKIYETLILKFNDYVELFRMCAESERFGGVRMINYQNTIDHEREMQFSAISFELETGEIVVTYRGTDDTVAGWKEDFNMWIMDSVPSQDRALEYLAEVANYYDESRFYLVGHSKGGNLAIYSAVNSPLKINSRIRGVINYDGPGFINNANKHKTYQRMLDRIITFVPENSIIGILLERMEDDIIVKSSENVGFLQHYGFTWEVEGTRFVRATRRARESYVLDDTLNHFALESSEEDKHKLLEALSLILKGYENYTLSELTADKIKLINQLARNYEGIDKDIKNVLTKSLRFVFSEGIKSVRKNNKMNKMQLLQSKNTLEK